MFIHTVAGTIVKERKAEGMCQDMFGTEEGKAVRADLRARLEEAGLDNNLRQIVIRTPRTQVVEWITWGRTHMYPISMLPQQAREAGRLPANPLDDRFFSVLQDGGLDLPLASMILCAHRGAVEEWLEFARKYWW